MKQLALSIDGTPIPVPSNIPVGPDVLNNVINLSLSLLIATAIIAALIFLIIGGIKWITSEGDKQKIEEARKTLTFAIIGLLVVLFSFLIINLIGSLLGTPFLLDLTQSSTR